MHGQQTMPGQIQKKREREGTLSRIKDKASRLSPPPSFTAWCLNPTPARQISLELALFPWASDLDPASHGARMHSLCPGIMTAATEAQADKTWWMQIVCGVTDSFVYSGMVPSGGAALCNPFVWEEPKEGERKKKGRKRGRRSYRRALWRIKKKNRATRLRAAARRVHFSLQSGGKRKEIGMRGSEKGQNNKVSSEQRGDRKDAFSTFPVSLILRLLSRGCGIYASPWHTDKACLILSMATERGD